MPPPGSAWATARDGRPRVTLEIRDATPDDAAPVSAFLHAHMNARIPPERWRRLLDYPWRPPGAGRGRIVSDGGRVVGFMATVFSDRLVRGRTRRFCNLGSWYLLRDYRGTGVGEALLDSGMADRDVTYTTASARTATGRRIRARGWRVLDDHRVLIRPRDGAGNDRATIFADEEVRAEALDDSARRLLADHASFPLRRALIRTGSGDCLVVFHVKLKGEGVAYHEVLSASRPAVLAEHAQRLANRLVSAQGGVLAVDARWMGDPSLVPGASVERIPLARWFRSSEIEGRDVDHLYSETVLLDLKLP